MSTEENFADADRDGLDRDFDAMVKPGVWVTRDGAKMRIRDMTNSHLLNSIRMLERNKERAQEQAIELMYRSLGGLHGEHAIDAGEQALDFLENGEVDTHDIFPVYVELTDEAERRGLNWFAP